MRRCLLDLAAMTIRPSDTDQGPAAESETAICGHGFGGHLYETVYGYSSSAFCRKWKSPFFRYDSFVPYAKVYFAPGSGLRVDSSSPPRKEQNAMKFFHVLYLMYATFHKPLATWRIGTMQRILYILLWGPPCVMYLNRLVSTASLS
jgi:hypothetical protein